MTASPLEARCSVCLDTANKSQQIDGFLDCTACDAAQKRLELRNYLGGLSPFMDGEQRAWAAYLFAQRQAATVAAQPVEVAEQDDKAAFEAWAKGDYDLRPYNWKVISVSGVPYDGYVRPYKTDRTVYAYEGFIAGRKCTAPQPAAQPSDDVALTDKQCAKIKAKAAKATDDWLESQPEENPQLKSDGIFIRHIAAAIKAAMAQEKA